VTVSVLIDNRSGWSIDEEAAVGVLRSSFEAEGIKDGEIGLTLVGPDEIARLNGAYRGKRAATDVLSFPIDGDEPLAEGLPRQLGDVVICPEVADEMGMPVATLLVHSALHLLGWTHDGDDMSMLDRQDALVARSAEVRVVRPDRK
jgi:probable rRNA maturation factor